MQHGSYNGKILARQANINAEMLAGKVNMIAKILARLAYVNGTEILLLEYDYSLTGHTCQALCFSCCAFDAICAHFIFILFTQVDESMDSWGDN